MIQVGFTEAGDAALDNSWHKWVDKGLPAVLITKDFKKVIGENPSLFFGDNLSGNVILHATITGLGKSPYEPNVPGFYSSFMDLKWLIANPDFHKERLVIRIDPIVIPFTIFEDPEQPDLLPGMGNQYRNSIFTLATFAVQNNIRLRLSFFDYYPHVRARLTELRNQYTETDKDGVRIYRTMTVPHQIDFLNKIQTDMHLPLEIRLEFLELMKKETGLTDDMIEICGEPGMKCTGCLSQRDLNIFGIELDKDVATGLQRPACACLGLKKELLNNKHPCGHNCIYCYWKR